MSRRSGPFSCTKSTPASSQGNLWVGDNFTVGWQAQDTFWQGNATKFAPNGRPLSPITTGFAGGGMQGGTFGAAVDAKDNAWFSSYGGKSIAVFDKNGKPLTGPPRGGGVTEKANGAEARFLLPRLGSRSAFLDEGNLPSAWS